VEEERTGQQKTDDSPTMEPSTHSLGLEQSLQYARDTDERDGKGVVVVAGK
jgi:hypothetical protein